MKSIVLAAFALFVLGCGTQAPVNRVEERAQVRTVVTQLITAFETENMGLLAEVMAHDADMVNFGTDASERWVGWNALADAAQKQFDAFDDTKLTAHDQVIALGAGATTAWFSEVVDWDLNASGAPVQIVGSRLTGVLEKRNSAWVCVQFHFSAPVAGQAAPY